jgi:hypothetical protein
MSKLPVPTHVADDALIYAGKLLDEARSVILFGMDVTVWDPEYGSRLMQNEYKKQALFFGPHGLQNVIDNARAGDPDADKALRDLYSAARHEHIDVPDALRVYVDEFVLRGGSPKRSRGRVASKNAVADFVIASCVETLRKKFNLPPTRRGSASHNRSACDLIVLAMRERPWTGRSLDYKRVEGLWIRFYGRAA